MTSDATAKAHGDAAAQFLLPVGTALGLTSDATPPIRVFG